MEFKLEIPEKQFKEHLGIENNNRIIFSAAFGTGKTYFLERFFEDNESYEAIHLFPVNYSVASNEDIFELIKYDILFKLLEEDLDFEKVKIDKGTFLPFFLENHATEIIPFLLGVIPKVGGSLREIAQGLIDLDEKFNKEFKEANLTDQDRIISYLAEFTKNQGSVNEEDFYTQLICSLVNQLKEKGKEIVLIIDDLDRIDPEHIFRILNVLAAHVDVKKDSDQNKFDFNRIILVCDIENIRKIFSNRYGVDVDFSGYIDKFYSRSIFHYDLSGEIVKKIDQVFQTVSISDGKSEKILAESSEDSAYIIIKYILLALLEYNLVPIRTLKRILNKSHVLKDKKIQKNGTDDMVSIKDIEIVKATDFLVNLFQDFRILVEKCEFLTGRESKNPLQISRSFILGELIKGASFKEYHSNISDRNNSPEKNYEIKLGEYFFIYKILRRSDNKDHSKKIYFYQIISVKNFDNQNISVENIDLFQVLSWLLKDADFQQALLRI